QRLDRRASPLLQALACRLLPLQALRQTLLQVAHPGAFVPSRLTGDGPLGLDLALPRLCPPTHRPLPSHERDDRTDFGDRLGEDALMNKSDDRVLARRGTSFFCCRT